jgi:uncharacterized protein YaeQ
MSTSVHRAELNVADLDRGYYADHALTIARHPSETEERMMVRVLAFALHAHERLAFGRGIGTAEEPDLWQRDLTGRVELWIDVGLPDERRIRKACNTSERVVVYAYGATAIDRWWARTAPELSRCENLDVIALGAATTNALTAMAQRGMSLQLTVQDGEAWFAGGDERVTLERNWLMQPPGGGPGRHAPNDRS